MAVRIRWPSVGPSGSRISGSNATPSGNSVAVAKILAAELEDTIVRITTEVEPVPPGTDRVGFVFPCYYFDVPGVVRNYIRKLDLSGTGYVYGILTHGGDPGNSLSTLKGIVEECGGTLSFGDDVRMPANSRVLFGGRAGFDERLVEDDRPEILKIVERIRNGKRSNQDFHRRIFGSFVSKVERCC